MREIASIDFNSGCKKSMEFHQTCWHKIIFLRLHTSNKMVWSLQSPFPSKYKWLAVFCFEELITKCLKNRIICGRLCSSFQQYWTSRPERSPWKVLNLVIKSKYKVHNHTFLTFPEQYLLIITDNYTQRKKGTKTVPLGHYCYKWYPFFKGALFFP